MDEGSIMPEFELSDDGEFAEPIDTGYGVYSARRKTHHLPFFFAFSGVFACVIVWALYMSLSSH
jgi:hypothetical protein